MAVFFPVKILLEKVSKNEFFQLLEGSWFWWLCFSCHNFNRKSIEKLIFPTFGRILVLVAAFFPVKLLIEKVLKHVFFELLAGS